MRAMTVSVALSLCATIHAGSLAWSAESSSGSQPLTALSALEQQAGARVRTTARATLAEDGALGWKDLDETLHLGAPEAPNYLRALSAKPHAVKPFAELVHAFLYRGALPAELKAAMGLRIAQVNASPYVAAHMERVLRGSERGQALLRTLRSGTLADLGSADRLALEYAEALTRKVHGVTTSAFEKTREAYNDSEIVDLTMTVCFFNYFTRYAEALRLPVEAWAPEGVAPPPAARDAAAVKPRVALISDDEIAAMGAVAAAAKEREGKPGGWGIGIANSQRAMYRVPDMAAAWRAYGTATREKEAVGRDIKLQISFAVSVSNDCRYCTLHQVLGLRRLGVDPAKLVAMRKDDSALTPREATAVLFARKLTEKPSSITDEDYEKLRSEFGEEGALEVVLQTCNFAFMNRLTDGLLLPSEDEAVRVYQEVYGGSWQKERSLAGGAPAR